MADHRRAPRRSPPRDSPRRSSDAHAYDRARRPLPQGGTNRPLPSPSKMGASVSVDVVDLHTVYQGTFCMFALPEDHRAACCCAWWERRAKQATCPHTVLRLHREEGWRMGQQP